jgi:hypothetical protein
MEISGLATLGLIWSIFIIVVGVCMATDSETLKVKISGVVMLILGFVYIFVFYTDPDFHIYLLDKDIKSVKNDIVLNEANCFVNAKDDESKRICNLIAKDLKSNLSRLEMTRDNYLVKKYKNK